MTTHPLTGSGYVRAVIDQLIADGAKLDLTQADLDEEACAIPDGDGDWLRWAEDYGWYLLDERGFRAAPLCGPYTRVGEAARLIAPYIT